MRHRRELANCYGAEAEALRAQLQAIETDAGSHQSDPRDDPLSEMDTTNSMASSLASETVSSSASRRVASSAMFHKAAMESSRQLSCSPTLAKFEEKAQRRKEMREEEARRMAAARVQLQEVEPRQPRSDSDHQRHLEAELRRLDAELAKGQSSSVNSKTSMT
jgi:hypothetical protein